MDPKQCTIRPSLGHKSLQCWSSSSIFVFKIKPNLGLELWTVLTNLSEKPCRSKRKRKLRGNPLQKRDQHWNSHQQVIGTLLLWNGDNGLTLKYRNPRILIVFKCQNSFLDYFGTVNKLIEKKMQESITTKWQMDISSGERWRTEEKVSILLESGPYSEILVPSSNPRTLGKYNRSCIARQCTVTRRFHRVYLSGRKRKRIQVNSESWLDSRRSQSQNRQTSCAFHCCESDG